MTVILIQDFSSRGIRITGGEEPVDEQITYDLAIGSIVAEPSKGEAYELQESYDLKPNRCLVVWTQEELSVPDGVFGSICSRASLSARGLIVANTKVDPLFKGQLAITVVNAGNRVLPLRRGQRFCSVYFQSVERSTLGEVHRVAPTLRLGTRRWYKDLWLAHSWQVVIAAFNLLLACLVAIVTVYLTQ